jgi:hypothetical protein
MMSKKFSSATKRRIADALESENDQTMDLLIQVSEPLSPETEAAINNWGGHIRTRAGDVVSLSLPFRYLDALAQLDPITYIEVAEPLFPESSDKTIGE